MLTTSITKKEVIYDTNFLNTTRERKYILNSENGFTQSKVSIDTIPLSDGYRKETTLQISMPPLMSSSFNRGSGAGGSKTNKNGLPYEELTALHTHYKVKEHYPFGEKISFDGCKTYMHVSKSNLFRYMKEKGHFNEDKKTGHGCKRPDEAFIDEENKIVYIIEKKFQCVGGSTCEKVQTVHCKSWLFERQFHYLYKIVYIFCLSDWFYKNCKAEIEYLNKFGYTHFNGSDINYKTKIISFIQSRKNH